MKKIAYPNFLNLSWKEIGLIAEGMSFASVPIRLAIQNIKDEFSLGPRGAWMILLISRGDVYPLDLTNVFQIGHSLVTAELVKLKEAGLITCRKSASDGRQVEIVLTRLGVQVGQRVKQELTDLVNGRLSSYTSEEVMLCARMLHDFSSSARANSAGWTWDRGSPTLQTTTKPATRRRSKV